MILCQTTGRRAEQRDWLARNPDKQVLERQGRTRKKGKADLELPCLFFKEKSYSFRKFDQN